MLIILGSAVWPYVKMLMMLFAWFVPVLAGGVGEKRRGTTARVLDLLGRERGPTALSSTLCEVYKRNVLLERTFI